MHKLKIPASKTTFGILFDHEKGMLEFSGNSYPPNAMDFFGPLLHWLDEYLATRPKETKVVFKINYFNTTSSKYIFKLLEVLDKFNQQSSSVNLFWHFNEEEEDLYESWKALIYELDLPHQLIKG